MDRLRNLASFVAIVAVIFAALRLLHLGIPFFYPSVLPGPFHLDQLELVEQYTGFSPRLPFYRPQQLGVQPVEITVSRRPQPKVVILWQAEHFLRLSEQRGGKRPANPGARQTLPGRPDSTWTQEGGTNRVVIRLDDLWIELRTDLSAGDVQRIVETLRPYEELL